MVTRLDVSFLFAASPLREVDATCLMLLTLLDMRHRLSVTKHVYDGLIVAFVLSMLVSPMDKNFRLRNQPNDTNC